MRQKPALLLFFMMIFLVSCQEVAPRGREYIPVNSETDTSEDPPPTIDEILRPLDGIKFKQDYCACKDTAAIILAHSSCTTFCSTKNTGGQEILYINFTPSEEVALTDELKTPRAWCTRPFQEGQNVSCVMTLKSEAGDEGTLELQWTNDSAAKINISTLSKDKTYIFTAKIINEDPEKVYKSDSIQIRKPSDNTGTNLAPLPVVPVNQYTCLLLLMQQDTETGHTYYNQEITYHFNFIDRSRPDPIPVGTSNFRCHDIHALNQGLDDNAVYPRLQETAGVYALWDAMDPRFFDLNNNQKRDIDETIQQKIIELGFNLTTTPVLFELLKKMSTTTSNTQAGNANMDLGYFMKPWVDADNLAFCPNQTHYYSNNPYFIALRDIIGTDTEALYLAKKEPVSQTNDDGTTLANPDFIYVRETDVKKAWYYLKNNTIPTQPLNATTVKNNTIMFNYPFNFDTPYIKQSTQKTYTVLTPEQAAAASGQTTSTTTTGVPTVLPTHDRRVGCVPKLGP